MTSSPMYGSRAYYEDRIAIADKQWMNRQNYLEALDEASCHLHVAVDAYSELLGTYDDGTLAALASVVGRVVSLGAAAHARQKVARAALEELQEKLSAMPVEAAGA